MRVGTGRGSRVESAIKGQVAACVNLEQPAGCRAPEAPRRQNRKVTLDCVRSPSDRRYAWPTRSRPGEPVRRINQCRRDPTAGKH